MRRVPPVTRIANRGTNATSARTIEAERQAGRIEDDGERVAVGELGFRDDHVAPSVVAFAM